MAEPPQAGSIARREDAGGPPERRSVLERLGLGKEPSERAREGYYAQRGWKGWKGDDEILVPWCKG